MGPEKHSAAAALTLALVRALLRADEVVCRVGSAAGDSLCRMKVVKRMVLPALACGMTLMGLWNNVSAFRGGVENLGIDWWQDPNTTFSFAAHHGQLSFSGGGERDISQCMNEGW